LAGGCFVVADGGALTAGALVVRDVFGELLGAGELVRRCVAEAEWRALLARVRAAELLAGVWCRDADVPATA
jgi:hypothetical protein